MQRQSIDSRGPDDTPHRVGVPSACRRSWCRWVLTVLLCAPAVGEAQVPDGRTVSNTVAFTLADAASLVRRQHPMLVAAGGRRQVTSGAARQEGAIPNPVLEWRKENYGSPLPRDEFLSATLPVDLYGRRFALRAASGFSSRRAVSDSAITARDVEHTVARAYWLSALANALRIAATAQRLVIDTIARIESERARQGAVSGGSALRAQLEADRARLSESAARADVERARGALARALALPIDSVPVPTDSLLPGTVDVLPSLAALLDLARARRSELRSARSQVDEASKRQLAERLGMLPALGMQVGSKRTSGYQTGTMQVGLTIPFFDRNGGNRERARGEMLIATAQLRDVHAMIDADVTAAARAYSLLLADYAPAVATGPAAADTGLRTLDARGATVARIAATAYREGAIPLFELLDAERVRAEVRVATLRAAADVQLARLDLLRALGLPVESGRVLLPPQ